MKSRLFACALVLASSIASAQSPMAPIIAPIAAPVSNNAVLRTGTEVPLKLLETLTTEEKSCELVNVFGWRRPNQS